MLNKVLFTATFIVTSLFRVEAQNIDSLLQEVDRTVEPSEKVNVLIKIGQSFEKQSLDSALYYHQKALDLAIEISMDTLIARCYTDISNVNIYKGKFDLSLDYLLKARDIYLNYPNNRGILTMYNSLGLIYFYQENYESALNNFFEAMGLVDKFYSVNSKKADRTRGRILNNIGIAYDNLNSFDEALEYFTRASTYSKKADDLQTLPSIYSNMGIIYLKTDRYELAESIFKEAYEIRLAENDIYGLCRACFHLGSVYNAKGQYEQAEDNFRKGIDYCKQVNSTASMAALMNEYAQTKANLGDFESAYKFEVEFKTLSDSLFKMETQEKITRAEAQFNYEKESQAEEAKRSERELVYIIIATILIFGVITTVVMFLLQKSKLKNNRLAKEKAIVEKESAELANRELFLRKQNLEYELEFKNKELTTNVMYLLKKNEMIAEVSNRLVDLKKEMKVDNQRIIQKIIIDLQSAKDDDVWEEFEVRFNQVYNDFYKRLHDKFPALTPSEKKICAFLRLNMTSKEICALTRQSHASLNMARTRLRKKLNLDGQDVNLVSFLESV
ncbi:MAG TPA: tetratricopeptide repeat protein [Fulvivirga sp.]|nr:tetratricopeptide repeat protein [Fulvivirga sp.]